MTEDFQPHYTQLLYDTQLSLHRYHKAITSLLDAVENRSSKERSLTADTREIPIYIKDSLLDIQTLQLKKLRLFNKEKPSFIEQTYLQPLLSPTKDVIKTKPTIIKLSKTSLRTSEFEPQKNMVSFKMNLSSGVKETFTIEDKPLPPWRPNP